MSDRSLTESQKTKVGELLSSAISNKEHPHPADLRRAAVILYDVNRLGYYFGEGEVDEIIEKSKEPYSAAILHQLQNMANAYTDLVSGINNPENKRLEESDLE